jgi:hypothetical protein
MLLDLKRDIDALKREAAGQPPLEPVARVTHTPLYHVPPPAPYWGQAAPVAAPTYMTQAAMPMQPPPLATADQTGSGSIEDTTAELLRPMLRQWLSENMPRMVEKALHIEVADSVKLPRKPGPF